MCTTVELQIYSPRWGHDDTYEVTLTRDALVIALGPRSATCTWRDNLDPEWGEESLEDILRNDSIYPPSIFPRLLEHAWRSWRDGDLDDAAVDTALKALADWLNGITRTKPDSGFWRKYF